MFFFFFSFFFLLNIFYIRFHHSPQLHQETHQQGPTGFETVSLERQPPLPHHHLDLALATSQQTPTTQPQQIATSHTTTTISPPRHPPFNQGQQGLRRMQTCLEPATSHPTPSTKISRVQDTSDVS